MFKVPQQIIVAHYEIDKKKYIGKGQYGVVYGCKDVNNDQLSLCAKVLLAKEVEQVLLKREIDILRLLMHVQKENENLVLVYDVLEEKDKGQLYIIMELCNDGDLKQLMDKRKKQGTWFTVKEATDIVGQIARGYKSLYQNKIIHRDIKPANILISNQTYKIADLGMGRIIEDMNYATNFTKVGTPAYAAPQLFLDSKFSSKADVYSLGVIFYQLIYGQLPIEARTQPELIEKLRRLSEQQIQCPLQSMNQEEVPENVRALIEQMLFYEESRRLSWMDVFGAPVLNLNIVHLKQSNNSSRRLTLTNIIQIQYQNYYRVNEIADNKFLQMVRILTNKSDLANKAHKYLQEQKSHSNPLPLTIQQQILLSLCLSGYRYKIIQNILGLLLNQYYQLIPQLQQFITKEELAQFYKNQDEQTKFLKEYIQKALNQAILMFREDECRFFNQGSSIEFDVHNLKKVLEEDDDTNFLFYSLTFQQFYKTIQNRFNINQGDPSNLQLIKYLEKFNKLEDAFHLQQILYTRPSDILEKTQIIN